jgi:hypothetical protein
MTAATILRAMAIAVAAGALLAILGPFGSYLNGGPAQRAGYWICAMLIGLVLYGTAFKIVAAFVPADSRMWWPSLIGATLLTSLPQTLLTRAGAFWLWPELARLHLPWQLWFAQTATIGLVAVLGGAFILRRSAPASRDRPAASSSHQRDGRLGRDVLALQMEGHYVRVHRPQTAELILMPLAHAIERIEAEGLRTHRSWWVARHAVVAVEGNARSMRLHLSNGVVAPVARSAIIRLKAAGWIRDRESDGGFQDLTAES